MFSEAFYAPGITKFLLGNTRPIASWKKASQAALQFRLCAHARCPRPASSLPG